MARIKMHIPKAKLPFYPPYEVKCRLQNGVSTIMQTLPLVSFSFGLGRLHSSHLTLSRQAETRIRGLQISLANYFIGLSMLAYSSWESQGFKSSQGMDMFFFTRRLSDSCSRPILEKTFWMGSPSKISPCLEKNRYNIYVFV